MKRNLTLAATFIFLTACASTAQYSKEDQTPEGVRVDLGPKNGVREGDCLRAFVKDCSPNPLSRGCSTETVGHLTVSKVENPTHVIAKPTGELKFSDSVFFEKENTQYGRQSMTDQNRSCF